MERCDPNKTKVKQTDILVKNLRNTHKQEVHSLQQQLDSLNKKFVKKVIIILLSLVYLGGYTYTGVHKVPSHRNIFSMDGDINTIPPPNLLSNFICFL